MGLRLSLGLTSLLCLGEHFPARWMSWDWSTWITKGERAKLFHTDSKWWPLQNIHYPEQEEEIATRLFSCTVKHFRADEHNWLPPFSYQRPAASLTGHYSPYHRTSPRLSICLSADLSLKPCIDSLCSFSPVSDAIHISAKGNCFATFKKQKIHLCCWHRRTTELIALLVAHTVHSPVTWGSGDAAQKHEQHEQKHRHP